MIPFRCGVGVCYDGAFKVAERSHLVRTTAPQGLKPIVPIGEMYGLKPVRPRREFLRSHRSPVDVMALGMTEVIPCYKALVEGLRISIG